MVGEAWLNYARPGPGNVLVGRGGSVHGTPGVYEPETGDACSPFRQHRPQRADSGRANRRADLYRYLGLDRPGRPAQAAELAGRPASVSHDGNGLHGAAFMAACVAAAFEAGSLEEVLEAGLEEIPADCDYRRVVDAVRAFHAQQPEDFRACRDYVNQKFGPHRFPGYCHIIPNAGICVLAMLYAGGELGRAIEISVMCGFDTDCNASNIGTILGVLTGWGCAERYRAPIRDSAVLSSVSGYLNMLDFPTFAKELGETACLLRGEALPRAWPAAEGGTAVRL